MPKGVSRFRAPLADYAAKRRFGATAEPAPDVAGRTSGQSFVVQKHVAVRARLHWDFRLEQDGVLWSWAIPKGPSLDPADKRMAIHVEDHPLAYAGFSGEIAEGQYGAGQVEVWDRGEWTALDDPVAGMRKGHLHFALHGERLRGAFNLVRLPPRGRAKQEAWLLIKVQDDAARAGGDAAALEALPIGGSGPPAPGARRAALPQSQTPQLCTAAGTPPSGPGWVSEVKFDGYRLIARVADGRTRLLTRNGHDWSDRLPGLAQACSSLPVGQAMLDGELVAMGAAGKPDFGKLQQALSEGQDGALTYHLFDLLHLNGWDLRPAPLLARKTLLRGLSDWRGRLRISDHHEGDAAALLQQAAKAGLEGIIVKRADAPYRAGRGHGWIKVKCLGRQEFVILGWTPPGGGRVGLGALHVGAYAADGRLHYAGGVGTGFSEATLRALRQRLDRLAAERPAELETAGEKLPRAIRWVQPKLVAELSYTDRTASGRLRHAVFLGLREDKTAADVRLETEGLAEMTHDDPPAPEPPDPPRRGGIVVAQAPRRMATRIAGVEITHATRPLWPGITKRDLADYWQTISDWALPGIAQRPLAILRCPEGIGGEQFFQKNRHGTMPDAIRDGSAAGQPFLAIDDVTGLVAMAQLSAIELHTWGAAEADAEHPDRLVFDLDPGAGVAWAEVVQAARDLRARLEKLGLAAFCRTSGGKGLHVVVPLIPGADWPAAKQFCRAFAETVSAEEPKRFLAHTKIADRKGRILIDWLRNGPGATAIASFSPRARPGAAAATPLAWREVTARLDPAAHTIRTLPGRLARLKADPWAEFEAGRRGLPQLEAAAVAKPAPGAGASRIVVASRPRRRETERRVRPDR